MELIKQLSYLVLESNKTDEWRRYATEFLGMEIPAEQAGEYMRIRMDDFAYRFLIKPGSSEDLWAAGFLVANNSALEEVAAHVVSHGVEVHRATPAELAERDVQDMIWLLDPNGLRIEITCNPKRMTTPAKTPLVQGGFLTGDMGLGHIAIAAPDLQASEAFYKDVLGFKLSDYIVQDIQGIPIKFTFFHINPRHHTLALAGIPIPARLNHVMVEVKTVDEVGFALERAREMGINLYMNIGRHPNDRMLSFYANTPSEFAVEFGAEGIEIRDEANWEIKTFDALSDWGHKQ
jgi:3,4-dihydroxy-9,10-secoandrosta-1,3,5(10)-triene-9,17-dione 4,5-dioxygenase